MADPVERVFAAAIEGQAQGHRFIQRQLSNLHTAFVKAGDDLRTAVRRDSKQTASEIEIQYALALESIASFFSEINFEKALDSEYTLVRSENSPDNRCAHGVAYIEPSKYNLVYSCATAVAAAIAAGNCVILKLPRTLSTTSETIKRILSEALDSDTFTVAEQEVDVSRLARRCIRLYASPNTDISSSDSILTVATTRSIAIVDRYADMQKAASAILRARFAFEGQSPVAPHLVLVNEFRIKEFCTAIAENTSKYFASQVEANGGFDSSAAAKSRAMRASSHELDKSGAETLISGSRGTVVRIDDRNSSLLKRHINEPLLVIHPVRSLDDAMDLANSTSEDEPLAALHVFGSPEVGKYASQFVHNYLTCVNDIPVELIVAPLTPLGFAAQVGAPYTKEMFSLAKPQYIKFGEKSAQLASLIEYNSQAEAIKLRKQAQKVETQVKQAAGHAIGYFEQGLIVGASVAVMVIVSGVVMVFKHGIPAVRRWRV